MGPVEMQDICMGPVACYEPSRTQKRLKLNNFDAPDINMASLILLKLQIQLKIDFMKIFLRTSKFRKHVNFKRKQ